MNISRGRFDCVLYGAYVGLFKEMFDKSPPGLPIVVMQFAKDNREKAFLCISFYL